MSYELIQQLNVAESELKSGEAKNLKDPRVKEIDQQSFKDNFLSCNDISLG